MRKVSLILAFILLQNLFAKEKIDCLQAYQDSLAKKEDKYQKAYERYRQNRNSAQSAILMDGLHGTLSGGGLIGSAYLQNTSAPLRSDYDMFERDIIQATQADLSQFISLKPIVLEGIYNEAYERYSDITYEKIQKLMQKGFQDGAFCTPLGKKRVPGIKRYVLKQLKNENQNSALTREPAVNDSDLTSKEYTVDPVAKDEEINKPLEIYTKEE